MPDVEVVLRICTGDGQPLVDAAFLTSIMQGMAKHDDGMQWEITVGGCTYARTGSALTAQEMVEDISQKSQKQPRWWRRRNIG